MRADIYKRCSFLDIIELLEVSTNKIMNCDLLPNKSKLNYESFEADRE